MTVYFTSRGLGRVEIGPMRDSERSLVCSSWVHSVVDAMGHGTRSGSKHRHAYMASMGYEVDAEMARASTVVLVARDAECQARAYGWIAGDDSYIPGTLLWCFVKHDHRREGVARSLLDALARELDGVSKYARRSRHDALAERAGLTYVGDKTRKVRA